MLPCKARKAGVPMSIGTMTGGTSGHTFRRYTTLVDLATASDVCGVRGSSAASHLLRVVAGERIDGLIRKLTRHSPHVADGVRVATRLCAEVPQLRRKITSALPREAWVLRLHAVAARSMAALADSHCDSLRVAHCGSIELGCARTSGTACFLRVHASTGQCEEREQESVSRAERLECMITPSIGEPK